MLSVACAVQEFTLLNINLAYDESRKTGLGIQIGIRKSY